MNLVGRFPSVCIYTVYIYICVRVFAVYYQCLLGKSCRSGGQCLSPSQWCDGVRDCSHGEDEFQCCKTQIKTALTHTYKLYLFFFASSQWPSWWLNIIVLSQSQSVTTGPTSSCKVTPLTERRGCRCALKTGTTAMEGRCVSTWDTKGADCLLHHLVTSPLCSIKVNTYSMANRFLKARAYIAAGTSDAFTVFPTMFTVTVTVILLH